MSNLQTLIEAGKAIFPAISPLGLNSDPTTAAPSQPWTPRYLPIYINLDLIGQGEFGEVKKSYKLQ